MSGRADAPPTLEHLTPELAVEVRQTLTVWLVVAVAGVAALSAVFALAVDPGLSGVAGGVAVAMIALFLALLVPVAGLLLTLVYLFGCWPAVLRRRYLAERYRVAPEYLSPYACRREMGSSGFWAAACRGAIVGWAFVSAAAMAWWGLTGKWAFGGPTAVLVLIAAQIAGQAWVVRRVVGRQAVRPGVPGEAEPGAAPDPARISTSGGL